MVSQHVLIFSRQFRLLHRKALLPQNSASTKLWRHTIKAQIGETQICTTWASDEICFAPRIPIAYLRHFINQQWLHLNDRAFPGTTEDYHLTINLCLRGGTVVAALCAPRLPPLKLLNKSHIHVAYLSPTCNRHGRCGHIFPHPTEATQTPIDQISLVRATSFHGVRDAFVGRPPAGTTSKTVLAAIQDHGPTATGTWRGPTT